MEIISKLKKKITMRDGRTTERMMVVTRCHECNTVYEKRWNSNDLKINPTCKSCATLRNNKNKIGNGCSTIGDLSGTFYNALISTIKQKNKKRKTNIKFEVSKEYLWNLFLEQDKKCAISGLPLNLLTYTIWTKSGKSRHHDRSIVSASLDRIDSNGDYSEGNVQWVHKVVNIMKNTLTDNNLVWMCKIIAENNKNKENIEPSFINGSLQHIIMKKVQRLDIEDNHSNNISKSAQQPESLLG